MIRYIYILTNNNVPVYVGKTNCPTIRKSKHKKAFPNYQFEIIDEVLFEEWRFWERFYISLFRSWGFNLLNKKLYAGNGADIVSNETREKLRLAYNPEKSSFKGRKMSEETKEKIRQSHLGKSMSFKGKSWTPARRAIVVSELTKLKMSESQKIRYERAKDCMVS